jgi:D-alanyl-lipoteichoic acid acyltransferase DltB (MBOAT superfamily)
MQQAINTSTTHWMTTYEATGYLIAQEQVLLWHGLTWTLLITGRCEHLMAAGIPMLTEIVIGH